jgi:hypothetical protein
MTDHQAKKILSLYRPGAADANDAGFSEALAQVRQSPELQRWFDKHCAVQEQIQTRFRQVPVPDGLKQQILSEHKAASIGSQLKKSALLVGAAVLVTLGVMFVGRLSSDRGIAEDKSLSAYRDRMVGTALRAYGMDLETNDLGQIRSYLEQRRAVTGWTLSPTLEQTTLTGCGVLGWQGRPVSMICFHSGKPLSPAQKTDVFLFVVESASVENAPKEGERQIAQVKDLLTVSWSADGKTYVLAVDGDEALLRRFL